MCKTSKEIGGMGHSLKRKEDARFIRGLGKYTDDVQLPGMLYMDIARSPFAYAKIKSIDNNNHSNDKNESKNRIVKSNNNNDDKNNDNMQ